MTTDEAAATRTPGAPQRPHTAARHRLWSTVVPAAALAALLLGLLVFVVTQAHVYGRTYDEILQDDYGKRTLAWYLSAGRDHGFLAYPDYYQMPQHGPFVETIVATVQRLTGEDWTTRSIVTGMLSILGVLAIAACGFELGGWWLALLCAAGLALYPRYTGAMLNNSKDLPFTAAMTLVLWLVLRLLRRWDGPGRGWVGGSVAIGVAIGAAASIRVVAVVWFIPLGLLAAGWWWRHGRATDPAVRRAAARRQALAGLLVAGASWVTMCVLWPYIALGPVSNLIDSLRSMAKYPWGGSIPFDGRMYSAQALPRRYVLEWLVIGSPLHIAILAVVGLLLAFGPLARRRPVDARHVLCLLYLAVPVALLMALHSTLYNGLRQFMFVVPALVLFAGIGLVQLAAGGTRPGTARRVAAAAGVLVAVGGQAEALASMASLHPYEYVYFSPVVGGFSGAVGRYELDYWGVCNKPAAEWLARHGGGLRLDPGRPAGVAGNAVDTQFLLFLPADRFGPAGQDQPPDIFFWSMRERDQDPQPTYVTVHEEKIEGYTACVVQVRPDLAGG
jgi:hypothetical protein